MARRSRRGARRWKTNNNRYPTAWLRRQASPIALSGSATEFAATQLALGVELQQQSTAVPTVVLEMSGRGVTLKRTLLKLAVHFVQGAAGALIEWFFGVYLTKGGTTVSVFDPRISVGTAAQQAANASVDWLWLDTRSVAPAAGAFSLEELVGSPINLDIRTARRVETDDVLMFACAFRGAGGAAVNPGTAATVDIFAQTLWAGAGR